MKPLYLTDDELKVFEALPPKLKEGWDVESEKGGVLETDEEIRMRAFQANFHRYPAFKPFLEELVQGAKPDAAALAKLPVEAVQELFFVIGARGVHTLIGGLMHEVKNDEDVSLLAFLTQVRRTMLSINTSTVSSH